MAKVQGNIHQAIIAATTEVQDDVEFQFGTDSDARFIWETADANAHVLLLSLPAGGDPNVSIFVVGDDTSLNKDLGLFDGITKPGIGILSDDATQASVYYSDRIDLDDGDSNILIGLTAGDSITAGSGLRNICIGDSAGTAITTGDDNVVIGISAGELITTSFRSVLIGFEAGKNLTDNDNVFIGDQAGLVATSATFNVLIGSSAGAAITSGDKNVIIGFEAGDANAGITANTLLGYRVGSALGGNSNVFIGSQAGENAGAVSFSILIGKGAGGVAAMTGDFNVIIGTDTGEDITTGKENVIVGVLAAEEATTPDGSVILGYEAVGDGVLTGNDNTVVGAGAGLILTGGASNVLLGHDAGAQLTTEGGLLVIDNTDTLTPLIGGDFSARTVSLAGLANGQNLNVKTNTNEHTLAAAATSTISNFIPAGSFVLAVSIRVTTAVTTDGADPDDFDIGTAADPNLYGSVISGAVNTTTTIADQTAVTPIIYAAATDLIFDATGAEAFTAGVIRATVHYIDITAAAS